MSLTVQPVTFKEAAAFIREHHRHHRPTKFWVFGVGVAVVWRPVSRTLDDGWTLEVARCCTDGTKNVASMLYGAAWRAAKALGYRRLITYTLVEEPGTSLIAAGWRLVYQTTPNPSGWDMPHRPRVNTHPLGQKTLWEAA